MNVRKEEEQQETIMCETEHDHQINHQTTNRCFERVFFIDKKYIMYTPEGNSCLRAAKRSSEVEQGSPWFVSFFVLSLLFLCRWQSFHGQRQDDNVRNKTWSNTGSARRIALTPAWPSLISNRMVTVNVSVANLLALLSKNSN